MFQPSPYAGVATLVQGSSYPVVDERVEEVLAVEAESEIEKLIP
jgi:hypothetical protein